MDLKVKANEGVPVPKHAKPGDAGMDLIATADVLIWPHETEMVSTGLCVEIPDGYFGLVAPRSGFASKNGVSFANSIGVIDSGYRGEIKLPLHNLTEFPVSVNKGERVAQLIIIPFEFCNCIPVEELSVTERGTDGFGSTGDRYA